MPKKVLVVEDDTDNRRVLVRVLAGDGYSVIEAVDGGDALVQAHREHPDVIPMDLALSTLDGLAVARRIRAAPTTGGIPIIALTAFLERGGEQRARRAGCDDYLVKPATLSDIRAALNRYTRSVP